jgi:hypothetical protein
MSEIVIYRRHPFNLLCIIRWLDPTVEWTRRSADEISLEGNARIFRKKSDLYLARYRVNDEQIGQLESCRRDSQVKPIEDLELDHRRVRIRLNHDVRKHIKQATDLSSIDGDDGFLRSSSSSTNEQLLAFADE